jgi:hypothetical protein
MFLDLLPNLCHPKGKKPTLALLRKLHAQGRICAFLRDFCLLNNKLPTKRELCRLAKCDYNTAKPYLDYFKNFLMNRRLRGLIPYLFMYLRLSLNTTSLTYRFVLSNTSSIPLSSSPLPNLVKPFNADLYTSFIQGYYLLTKLFTSNNLQLITLTIPSDTSYNYLITSQLSKEILLTFLTKFYKQHPYLPKRYLWVSELQERGVIHWHIGLYLPYLVSEDSIRIIWCEVLDELNKTFNTDLYELDNGYRIAREKVKTHIGPWISAYLNKTKNKSFREINNIKISPAVWGGASKEIKKLIKSQTETISISIPNSDLARQAIEALKNSVMGNWKAHSNPMRLIGFKLALNKRELDLIKKRFYRLKSDIMETGRYKVTLKIYPSGLTKIYWG